MCGIKIASVRRAMKLIIIKKESLVPLDTNPRKLIDKAGPEKLLELIKRHGFQEPLQVWVEPGSKKYIILCGNHRFAAGLLYGMDTFPCIEYKGTRSEALARSISDNKSHEWTGWDDKKLKKMLAEIAIDTDINIDDISGFDLTELEQLINPDGSPGKTRKEDLAPPARDDVEPITAAGDLWVLGDHRLLCGDATSAADLKILMGGSIADMIFTDPPYLMKFEGNVHADGTKSHNAKHGKIKNDNLNKKEAAIFLNKIMSTIKENVRGAFYITFYRLGIDKILKSVIESGLEYRSLIIWEKGNHTLSNRDYMSRYEPIVYGWVKDHEFYGRPEYDVWNIPRTKINDLHPTMKPTQLCERAIINSSKKGDLVLDLFLGSGSTLIASEHAGRRCYGTEITPKYCDVILKRWAEYTGRDPIRQDGEKWSSLCKKRDG